MAFRCTKLSPISMAFLSDIPFMAVRRWGSLAMTERVSVPKAATMARAVFAPIPFIVPEARYSYIPLAVVGISLEYDMTENCGPCFG